MASKKTGIGTLPHEIMMEQWRIVEAVKADEAEGEAARREA